MTGRSAIAQRANVIARVAHQDFRELADVNGAPLADGERQLHDSAFKAGERGGLRDRRCDRGFDGHDPYRPLVPDQVRKTFDATQHRADSFRAFKAIDGLVSQVDKPASLILEPVQEARTYGDDLTQRV